jgi:hypothetical protein
MRQRRRREGRGISLEKKRVVTCQYGPSLPPHKTSVPIHPSPTAKPLRLIPRGFLTISRT